MRQANSFINNYRTFCFFGERNIIGYLKPAEYDNHRGKIKEIFKLEIKLDTLFYDTATIRLYKNYLFLGLITKKDSLTINYITLDPNVGESFSSKEFRKKWFLVGSEIFKNDLKNAFNNNCFNSTKYRYYKIEKKIVGFWSLYGSSYFYGNWIPNDGNLFHNRKYNCTWIITQNKSLKIDTVLTSYKIVDSKFIIKNPCDTFTVLTFTRQKFVLLDPHNNNFICFRKIK